MKKFISIILCLLVVLTATSLVGCKKETPRVDKDPDKPDIVKDEYIVYNSLSEYVITIPENATPILTTAASELKMFFSEATGIVLQTKPESQVDLESDKVFSLGKTSFITEQVINNNDLSINSFRIKTHGDDVFVLGGGDYGTLWGVYEVLDVLFDYEYYSENTYSINSGITELKLYDFNLKKSPEIEWRVGPGGQTYNKTSFEALRLTYTPQNKVLIGGYHNSFDVLNPDVYNESSQVEKYHPLWFATTGRQLCYTAHGDESEYEKMVNEAFNNLLPSVLSRSDAYCVSMQIQDNWDVCGCSACVDSATHYGGSNSAAVIKFCNQLYLKFKNYFEENEIDREIKISPFLYYGFEDVPAKLVNGVYKPIDNEVICKGVIPYYANLSTCVQNKPFTDLSNLACYEMLKKIAAICDEFWLWTYGVNFNNYLLPYNSYGNYQTNLKILKEFECSLLFVQNGWNAGVESRFGRFQEYLISKLSWNSSLDVEMLTENYFKNVYGAGYQEMLELYNSVRLRMNYNEKVLGAKSSVYDGDQINSMEMFPMGLLLNWSKLIEKAYEKIEYLKLVDLNKYESLRKNILIESIFVRYIYANIYLTEGASAISYKRDLVNDMRNIGMSYVGEGTTVEALASTWGV